MDRLWKKLNLKTQSPILILNDPESFGEALQALETGVEVHHELKADAYEFVMAFVLQQQAINKAIEQLAPVLNGDATIWFCYPKKSSKRYTCDFNRDTGWEILGKHGLEGVRQVAIDEDWSALRFRKVEFIKKMIRKKSFAMTKAGKAKTSSKE